MIQALERVTRKVAEELMGNSTYTMGTCLEKRGCASRVVRLGILLFERLMEEDIWVILESTRHWP